MFSESQIKAISFDKGAALVLAGPGSGKTTVITHRVKKLISEYHVRPEKILVVTFTKAAAVNMSLRFKSLVEGRILPVAFGTFHSVFFKILRNELNYKGNSIITDIERFNILEEIVIRLKVDVPSKRDFIQSVSDEISKAKGNVDDIKKYEPLCCDKKSFLEIYDAYEKAKLFENKVDFEDMLRLCYHLLKEKPEVLKKWQSIYEYILIDEFQDINQLQYEIVKMLAKPQDNVFIVGDDDQSIYGFRGSKPEIMFGFKKDFKNVTEIMLSNNYRSTKEIVKVAGRLISNNNARYKKKIVSMSGNGAPVDIRIFKSFGDEINMTCKMIKEYIKRGVRAEEIAILVRNNGYIPQIRSSLQNEELVTKTKVKSNSLYISDVARDVFSYINCALCWGDIPIKENEDLVYIINKPARKISREVLLKDGINFEKLKNVYSHNRMIMNNLENFEFHMKMIFSLSPYAAVNYIKNAVGYERYLKEAYPLKSVSFKTLKTQLENLQREGERFINLEEWVEYAKSQMNFSSKSLNRKINEQKIDDEKLGGVNLLTMHSAKGLEFKVVFILNVNQGIIPTSRASREQDFEEERRVFYVAVTRASEYLHVFCVGENLGFEIEPSMFLKELEK